MASPQRPLDHAAVAADQRVQDALLVRPDLQACAAEIEARHVDIVEADDVARIRHAAVVADELDIAPHDRAQWHLAPSDGGENDRLTKAGFDRRGETFVEL